jgi:hypothetical protein
MERMGSTVSARRRVGSASLSRVGSMSAESCRMERRGSTVSARRRVGSASLSRVGSMSPDLAGWSVWGVL